jgi:hypothetical protein
LPIIYPDLWLDYKVATHPFRAELNRGALLMLGNWPNLLMQPFHMLRVPDESGYSSVCTGFLIPVFCSIAPQYRKCTRFLQ